MQSAAAKSAAPGFQSFVNFLVSLGVQSSRISSRSKGELEPVDQGHDEAAWAKNRRVIFVGN
jgi:peptidoglycan-associated lipoprotein